MERRESPELSLEDFQKTTDTEDFGSSLLSSLDFNLDKYDGTKKDVAEPLLNKDLPSPKLQVEKKFSTASFRKNSPTISSPLSTPPEISSTRSENEMNNAHTILDSFPSLSRELGSISGKTPKSALKGQKNSLSNSSDGTAVQEELKNIKGDEFENMLNSTGTRKVTATDALVRERPISMPPSPLAAAPVDEFELLLSAPGTIKVSATSDKMQELDIPNVAEDTMPNRRSSLLGRIRLIGKTVQSGLRLQKSNMKSLSSSDFEKSPDSPLKKRTSLSLSIKSSKSATSMSEKQSEMIKMHQNELGQKLSLDSLQRQKSPEEAKKIVPTSSRAATKKSVVIVTPGTISEGKSSSSLISSEENDLSEIPYVLSPRSTSLRIPTPQQSELNSGKQSFSDSLSFPTPPTVERIQTIDIHKPIALLPQSKSASYSNVSISELIPEIHTRANSLPDTNESVTNEESSEWYPKPALRKKPSYRFSLSKVPSIPAFDDLIIADSFDVDSIASSTDEDINVKPKDSQLLHSLNSPTQSILDIPEVVEYSQPTEIKPKATLAEANSQTLTSSWESVQTQAHADIISTETQTVRVSIKQAELEDFSCQTEDALVPILYACYSFGCRQGDHCYSSSCPNRPQLAHCARCLEHDEETETRVEFLKFENVRLLQELSALTLMVQTARSQTQQMQILKEAAESRFEQLARVAHRKLVRAMVDNRT